MPVQAEGQALEYFPGGMILVEVVLDLDYAKNNSELDT